MTECGENHWKVLSRGVGCVSGFNRLPLAEEERLTGSAGKGRNRETSKEATVFDLEG